MNFIWNFSLQLEIHVEHKHTHTTAFRESDIRVVVWWRHLPQIGTPPEKFKAEILLKSKFICALSPLLLFARHKMDEIFMKNKWKNAFEQVDELLPFVFERIGHISRAKTTFHSMDGCRCRRCHRRGDLCVCWCLRLSLLHSQKPH